MGLLSGVKLVRLANELLQNSLLTVEFRVLALVKHDLLFDLLVISLRDEVGQRALPLLIVSVVVHLKRDDSLVWVAWNRAHMLGRYNRSEKWRLVDIIDLGLMIRRPWSGRLHSLLLTACPFGAALHGRHQRRSVVQAIYIDVLCRVVLILS